MAWPSLGEVVKSVFLPHTAVMMPSFLHSAPRPEESASLVCLCPPFSPPRRVPLCVTEQGSPCCLSAAQTRAGPPFRWEVLAGSTVETAHGVSFCSCASTPSFLLEVHTSTPFARLRVSAARGAVRLSRVCWTCRLRVSLRPSVAVTPLLSLLRTSLSRSSLLPTVAPRGPPALGCSLPGLLVPADQAAWTASCGGAAPQVKRCLCSLTADLAWDFDPEGGDAASSSGVCSVLLEKKQRAFQREKLPVIAYALKLALCPSEPSSLGVEFQC